MRRRRAVNADSLELLLDTICNTFGGVLFIAILVVVLLQTAGRQELSSPSDTVSPDEWRRMANRLTDLNAELASLREARRSQERVAAQFAPDELQRLLARRDERQNELDHLKNERERALAENAGMQARIAQTRDELEQTEEAVAESRANLARLVQELQQERQSRIEQVRMPIVRSSGFRQEVGLIVRFGRLYMWHRYDRLGNRQGLNTDEFVIVGQRDDALITMPNPTRGVPLDESAGPAIERRLEPFNPRNCYVSVAVRTDSFAQFRIVRDTLIRLGFDYRLMPMDEDAALVDRGGSGGFVQ